MSRPRTQPSNALCHAERPAYAHGLCRQCYDAQRWTGALPRSMSAAAREIADELVGKVPRAQRKAPESSRYIRTDRPKVAEHVAGVVVKNCMDYEKAASELKPDLAPFEVAQTAEKLEHDPNVQQEIQRTLQKRGLDEKSKEHFVDLLWKYTESEDPADERRQLQAMRILGKAFVGERLQIDKPEPLRMQGFEEGIKRMFGGELPPGFVEAET